MPPAVALRGAVSLAGGFALLAGVDLEVGEAEIVHLRGPNGAGKTSLLRACAGLVPISAGEAVVLGHDLRHDRESLRREVGLLGHAAALYDELTVEENLRFAVRSARGDVSAVPAALARLELGGRLARTRVGKLSAGQRRRAALAALVARRPRLWLLDEPHAGLDEPGRAVLDGLVGELRSNGATVLLASHELEHAAALADRVVLLAGGHVVAERPGGRPARRPAGMPEAGSAAPTAGGGPPPGAGPFAGGGSEPQPAVTGAGRTRRGGEAVGAHVA
jgi:heme ABC exporter ATP-binding subunit CcmA